jgi:hypothetical protein
MSGRPRNDSPPLKRYKSFHSAGRYKERVEQLHQKKQKLETMESLIQMHETQVKPDFDYIRDLKKRANEVRAQLAVMSTIEAMVRP